MSIKKKNILPEDDPSKGIIEQILRELEFLREEMKDIREVIRANDSGQSHIDAMLASLDTRLSVFEERMNNSIRQWIDVTDAQKVLSIQMSTFKEGNQAILDQLEKYEEDRKERELRRKRNLKVMVAIIGPTIGGLASWIIHLLS